MTLLLVILSVLALWVFLTMLVVGLLLILKALESVRTHMQKIAMGVRAIEQETAPLRTRVGLLTVALEESGDSLERVTEQLHAVAQNARAAGPALRRHG